MAYAGSIVTKGRGKGVVVAVSQNTEFGKVANNVLISKEEINKKLDEMAEILDRDYEGKAITVLSVLNGAVFFTTDLTSRMKTKMQFAFIKVSSYEGTESTGKIKLKADVDDSLIEGKDVLIVEDIVDTGRTMSYLLEHLKAKNPKKLKVMLID